jgi:hypothetical protein
MSVTDASLYCLMSLITDIYTETQERNSTIEVIGNRKSIVWPGDSVRLLCPN